MKKGDIVTYIGNGLLSVYRSDVILDNEIRYGTKLLLIDNPDNSSIYAKNMITGKCWFLPKEDVKFSIKELLKKV